jgi:hypothetical protein
VRVRPGAGVEGGEAKVRDLEVLVLVQQKVFGFQVPVAYALLIDVVMWEGVNALDKFIKIPIERLTDLAVAEIHALDELPEVKARAGLGKPGASDRLIDD